MGTGQARVFQVMSSMVLLGPDVIRLMRQNTIFLRKLAIFAATLCPLPNQFALIFRHGSTGSPSFLEGKASLGMEKVDELAHAEKLLQGNTLIR